MSEVSTRETIAWVLSALAAVCAVSAAYVKGGVFEALTAAGVAFSGLSYVVSRTIPPAATTTGVTKP